MNGLGGMQCFSTANGPPPGLAAPPGLSSSNGTSGGSMSSLGSPLSTGIMESPFGGPMSPMSGIGIPGMRSPSLPGHMATGAGGVWNGQFPDYMVSR